MKSEPYYFDYLEYEDLWKAKRDQPKVCAEIQKQVHYKYCSYVHFLNHAYRLM